MSEGDGGGFENFGSSVVKTAERVIEDSANKLNSTLDEPPNPIVNKIFREATQEQEKIGGNDLEDVEEIVRHAASARLLSERKQKEDSRYGHRRQRTMLRSHDYRQTDKNIAEGGETHLRGIKDEEHLLDHPPEMEIFLQKKFLEKVAEIAVRNLETHRDATFDDLADMMDAERDDQLENEDKVDMMKASVNTAKDFLRDHLTLKKRINKVNVSVSRTEDGKWATSPKADTDKPYFTFTRGRIAEMTNKLKFYDKNMSFLDHANEALQKINDKEPLDETEYNAQALYSYLREKEDYFAKGLKLVKDPADKDKLEACRRMFGNLLIKAYAYPKTLSPGTRST